MHIELNEVMVHGRHGPVIAGVTLTCTTPTCLVITGPGSCGKSVLHSVLRGTRTPSSGNLFVDGKDIASGSGTSMRLYRQRLGVIAQIPDFDSELTVFENILLAGAARGLDREQAMAAGLEALADVGMSHRRTSQMDELSDAERTLVGIARAFIGPVEMLLIDDAFVGLDESTLRTAIDMVTVTAARREIGMIITTSDATLADLVPGCQRYTMHDGRLSPVQEAT